MVGSANGVLLVDDDERVLWVLQRALQGLGEVEKVVAVDSGQEALQEAQSAHFDVLVTDLRMPGMDGIELTEQVRALDPEIAIIWVTAYGCSKAKEDASRLSVHQCFDKPIRVTELCRVVQETLDQAGTESTPEGMHE
jgi:CheY-like chemotaxis protein